MLRYGEISLCLIVSNFGRHCCGSVEIPKLQAAGMARHI